MRIMILAAGGDIGGGKTHILSLCKELSRDNDLQLISFRKGVLAQEGKEMGLNVIETENGMMAQRDVKVALDAVDAFKPEVIHCHGARANMVGAIVGRKRKIPVMSTVHSDPRLDYLGMPFKQHTFGTINNIALRRMDYLVSVASDMQKRLISRNFDPQRIFIVYNGLDFGTPEEAALVEKKRAAEQYPKERVVVGIAARLNPIKDISTVIRAVALAAETDDRICLKIAGSGEEEELLRNLVKELHAEDRVEFCGWVNDMKGFFQDVDVNVLASLSETFPYSLLEGAQVRCPAVASRVGGIPDLITHGETGFLFEPGDVKTFAGYLVRLAGNPALRKELGEALYKKARDTFSLERMKKDQEEIYRTVIRRRSIPEGRNGAVLCGAYGKGNAGDEAILRAILMQLREVDPDMDFWVMSRNKEETRLSHKVNSFYIFNLFKFFSRLRKAKLFVNGGGSLIQDVTSSRSLLFYLFTLAAAKACGCKVIMYGCGIGPLINDKNRKKVTRVLNAKPDVITLRDSNSYEFLKELNVTRPRITLAADPVVNLTPASKGAVEAAFEAEGVPADAKKMGFCLRNWDSFRNYEAVAEAADYASRTYGVLPVFLPVEIPKDIAAAEKVTALMKEPFCACKNRHSAEELIGMLGSMEAVVGMRLHSLVFSAAGGTPTVGISYDV
ncbi:MAG: polysaccharide pyruvyl transferase CsaB, partial [Firmicutes bacterium]|nr:polysaccharide pyruvyl transferase CsaB [Bacillota bacterium]